MDAAQPISTQDAILAVRGLWAVGGALVVGAGLLWKVATGVTALRKDHEANSLRIVSLEQSDKAQDEKAEETTAEVKRRIHEVHERLDEHEKREGHPVGEFKLDALTERVEELMEEEKRQSREISSLNITINRIADKVGA